MISYSFHTTSKFFSSICLLVFLFVATKLVSADDFKWYQSLLIKHHPTLNQFNQDYNLAYNLALLNDWAKEEKELRMADSVKSWRLTQTSGRFIEATFEAALKEQNEHSASPENQKLGKDHWQGRSVNKVFENWIPGSQLRAIDNKDWFKSGPFRLLAVVNRMDRAGDKDDRATGETASEPRALGELHLVYGLIDEGYEQSRGKAFPSTYVLAYRLPSIKWEGGRLVRSDDFSQSELLQKPGAWSYKMKWWATLWKGLSDVSLADPRFAARLRNILDIAVHPSNFLSMRSNTKINEHEFELREWYMIQRSQTLIPRKPRNEPYKCLAETDLLTNIVNHYWNYDYNDLDVTTRDPSTFIDSGRTVNSGKNGFFIARDNKSNLPEFEGFDISTNNGLEGCGDTTDEMPFEMHSSGNNVVRGERLLLVAPFARVVPNQFVWNLQPGIPEERRHAFAMRTCSGCHSQEAASQGFHIFPRLENKPSELSGFLIGSRGDNKFVNDGRTYKYYELSRRKSWLQQAYNREAVLFESLKRAELQN